MGILVFGAVGIVLYPYDKYFQTSIVVAMAVSYVVWGILHHYLHKDLCKEIVFEYLAVAFFGSAVFLSLIFSL